VLAAAAATAEPSEPPWPWAPAPVVRGEQPEAEQQPEAEPPPEAEQPAPPSEARRSLGASLLGVLATGVCQESCDAAGGPVVAPLMVAPPEVAAGGPLRSPPSSFHETALSAPRMKAPPPALLAIRAAPRRSRGRARTLRRPPSRFPP